MSAADLVDNLLDHALVRDHFTPEHRELRARAAGYFTPSRLTQWLKDDGGFLEKSQWKEFGRQGFLGVSLPKELGGQGLGILGSLILNEAFSRLGDLGMTLGMHVHNEITVYWLASTEETELREKFLPEMLRGNLIGCTCDTEPGGKVDSTAVRDGGELVVSGEKIYIVNGYNSDLCFMSLMLDGEPATLLIEKDRPGVRVVKVFDKLGTRAIDSVLLEFDDVRVPADHVVSKRGVQQLMHWNMVMTRARFLIAADACFVQAHLLERMLDYGTKRMVGSRALARWPINRQAMARAVADHELMNAGLLSLFERFVRRRYPVAEAAAVKWFCVDRAARFAVLCAEMQGGAGYMHDSEFLTAYAQVLGLTMAGGSPTTMRVIANGALACQEEIEATL